MPTMTQDQQKSLLDFIKKTLPRYVDIREDVIRNFFLPGPCRFDDEEEAVEGLRACEAFFNFSAETFTDKYGISMDIDAAEVAYGLIYAARPEIEGGVENAVTLLESFGIDSDLASAFIKEVSLELEERSEKMIEQYCKDVEEDPEKFGFFQWEKKTDSLRE